MSNDYIKTQIKIMISKIKELRSNNIDDNFEIEKYFMNNMSDFYDNYPYLVKTLCKTQNFDTDLTYLYKMLNILDDYTPKKEKDLSEELANQYLYPVINKK
jgi:hypothetical protein